MNWYELVNKDLYGVVGTGTERYNIGVTTISNLTVSGATNFSGTCKLRLFKFLVPQLQQNLELVY